MLSPKELRLFEMESVEVQDKGTLKNGSSS